MKIIGILSSITPSYKLFFSWPSFARNLSIMMVIMVWPGGFWTSGVRAGRVWASGVRVSGVQAGGVQAGRVSFALKKEVKNFNFIDKNVKLTLQSEVFLRHATFQAFWHYP